ncbi:GNAT family N-acetyltransferase [Bacillus sp. B-jedd]|uniref:GNAT family N-acetyltransferase n=1 Tax=Bacillus sp. B-jedd TaxID=1476857 RepID=UPI0005156EF5|nr:GNAT family N-acetyltransferase [Bacillus sp. B-jedd]CEG26196.1 N-acetyltransferase GCN5 [Bacillus sp. B-jedd]
MKNFLVKKIEQLMDIDINVLAKESKEEGFRFVERLVNDYESGMNTFCLPGEALFAVFTHAGEPAAIGGLNRDPFSAEKAIGRLRRFYVRQIYRRTWIGSLLLTEILSEAKKHYDTVVLHTDTVEADEFYTSYGFSKGEGYLNSTHFLRLTGEPVTSEHERTGIVHKPLID